MRCLKTYLGSLCTLFQVQSCAFPEIKLPGTWPFCRVVYQTACDFCVVALLFPCCSWKRALQRLHLSLGFWCQTAWGHWSQASNFDINTLSAIKTITLISPRELSSPSACTLFSSNHSGSSFFLLRHFVLVNHTYQSIFSSSLFSQSCCLWFFPSCFSH